MPQIPVDATAAAAYSLAQTKRGCRRMSIAHDAPEASAFKISNIFG
jgi:hypothetical protein